MGNQIEDPKFFEALSRLLRVKMIHSPEWYKILDKEEEFWDPSKLFEAKTSSCSFQIKENTISDYFYSLLIGGERFFVTYDAITQKFKIWHKKGGQELTSTEKPFLEVTFEFLEGFMKDMC